MIKYVLIVILSCILLIIINQNNLGVSPDSVTYIETAENITNGKGYVSYGKHVTHWPPVYSILLGFTSKIIGLSVLEAGKYLHIVFFLLFGITFKLILDEIGFNEAVKSFLLLILLVSRPLTVSLQFWSELPCLLFIALTFLFYLKWKKKHKNSILLIAGTFSIFALMTRYAAVGLLGGLFLNIILTKNRTFRDKISDTLFYITPLLLGIGCWLYYTYLNSVPAANRSLVVHIISVDEILNSVKTFRSWFISGKFWKIIFSVFSLIASYFVYQNKSVLKHYMRPAKSNIVSIVIMVLSYLLFLFLSISLFDAATPLNNRILSLLAPFIYLLLGYFLNFIALNSSKWMSITLMVLIFFSSINSSKSIWVNHYKNGVGYTSKAFSHYFKLMNVYIVPFEGETYTNAVEFLRFASPNYLNLKSLPRNIYPVTKRINDNYTDEVAEMQTRVSQNKAQVAYFDNINWRWYLIGKEDLLTQMKNHKLIEFKDGFILKANFQ
jgi:hypothetical protein